jgi:hypothetical protein
MEPSNIPSPNRWDHGVNRSINDAHPPRWVRKPLREELLQHSPSEGLRSGRRNHPDPSDRFPAAEWSLLEDQ